MLFELGAVTWPQREREREREFGGILICFWGEIEIEIQNLDFGRLEKTGEESI